MILGVDIIITSNFDISYLTNTACIICFSVILLTLILSIAINNYAMKKTAENLMKIE